MKIRYGFKAITAVPLRFFYIFLFFYYYFDGLGPFVSAYSELINSEI
jgi:hypothetical protein